MMKFNTHYFIFGLVIVVLISDCAPEEEKLSKVAERIEKVEVPSTIPSQRLGNLCSGEEECISFCQNNRRTCESYCKENKNDLCRTIFPPDWMPTYKNSLDKELSGGYCQGSGTVNFGAVPMKPEDILVIIPMGDMIGGHVSPIDHLYLYPIKSRQANIYAPANGTVVYVATSGRFIGQETFIQTYTIFIEHTCDFYTLLSLLDEVSPKIKEQIGIMGEDEQRHVRIPVSEGERVGIIVSGQSLDYNVYYTQAPKKQWVFPEHYTELGKRLIVDPFDYYVEPVKSQLLEKNPRTVPPLGGKFDHDIDGTLSGTWFEENTNWYEGLLNVKGRFGEYWKTHISFSPDPVDPSSFVISLGDFDGEAKQFGAKGNSPKPEDVRSASGLVVYELVEKGYADSSGNPWNFFEKGTVKGLRVDRRDEIQGVVLVQLMENRKIKFEAFPEKTASQVNGFTENAKIYER